MIKGEPSRMAAIAKMVEGETSKCDSLTALSRLSAVSLTPGMSWA